MNFAHTVSLIGKGGIDRFSRHLKIANNSCMLYVAHDLAVTNIKILFSENKRLRAQGNYKDFP